MEFVAFLRFRPSVSAADRDAALMRRAAWKYPDGITVLSEYWPMSGEYQVVTAFAADSITADDGGRVRVERRLRHLDPPRHLRRRRPARGTGRLRPAAPDAALGVSPQRARWTRVSSKTGVADS